MVLERLIPLPQDPPKPVALKREGRHLMSRRQAKSASATPLSPPLARGEEVARDLQQLRETTGQVVGSVFYGTMLRAMRESESKGKYGHGGRGEEVFAGQLHGILAERAGSATSGSIGEAVLNRLSHQQELITKGKFDEAA